MYEIQEVGDRHVKLQVKGIMDLYQQSVSVQRCSKRYLLVKTKNITNSYMSVFYFIINLEAEQAFYSANVLIYSRTRGGQ